MNRPGFTLIEALMAVILLGLAIAALVGANTAFTQANGAGSELSTSEFLLEQIRELTTTLPTIDPETETFGTEEASFTLYDDVDDFDGKSFCPPIAADRTVLNDFAAYRQTVQVENVSSSNFETVVADGASDFVRVTVNVFLGNRQVSSSRWIRARY